MEFRLDVVNNIPVVYTDEFYSEEEVQAMYDEAEKVRLLGLLGDDTGGAQITYKDSKTGKVETVEELSKNQSVWYSKIYSGDNRISDTLNITSKIYDKNLIAYLQSLNPYFVTMNYHKGTSILLSYYDESEHYKPHRDSCFVTVLTWLYKEPKTFEGGEFIIEDELKIDCVRGRTVFMPGYALHEVKPVVMPKDKQGKGLGRYTVSIFVDK